MSRCLQFTHSSVAYLFPWSCQWTPELLTVTRSNLYSHPSSPLPFLYITTQTTLLNFVFIIFLKNKCAFQMCAHKDLCRLAVSLTLTPVYSSWLGNWWVLVSAVRKTHWVTFPGPLSVPGTMRQLTPSSRGFIPLSSSLASPADMAADPLIGDRGTTCGEKRGGLIMKHNWPEYCVNGGRVPDSVS